MLKAQPQPMVTLPLTDDNYYRFETAAEADVTYLVIAWFAITESASLGIFPLLSALETTRRDDPGAFNRFFETGFQHFTDEQHHANLWCRALLDFVERYPEVVKRVELPGAYLRIMLKSIGKPHDMLGFSVDCMAFEVVMQALYEVLQSRLVYPPLAHIWQVISRDEVVHTEFGRYSVRWLSQPLSWRQKLGWSLHYWRNTLGVMLTIQPILKALDLYKPLPAGEFKARLAHYCRDTGILGSHRLMPSLLERWSRR